MKKTLSMLVLSVILLISLTTSVSADTGDTAIINTGVLDEYIAPSKSESAQIEKEQALKGKMLQDWKNSKDDSNIITPQYIQEYYTIPVTCYQQETDNQQGGI